MSIQNKVYQVLANNSWFVEINDIEGNYIEFQISFAGNVLNRVLKVSDIESKDLIAFKKKATSYIEDITAEASDNLRYTSLTQQEFIGMLDLMATTFLDALQEAYREHQEALV